MKQLKEQIREHGKNSPIMMLCIMKGVHDRGLKLIAEFNHLSHD